MLGPWCWNTAWMLSGKPELAALRRDLKRPAEAQWRVLRAVLSANRDTEYGRAHHFARVRSPAEFQQRVPTVAYDDCRPYIARIAAGEAGVLTAEPVRSLHPTGGTSGGDKLIPYTASLHRQFQRALRAWIADLFGSFSRVRWGRAYWSLSPALGPARRTAGGIPIGFDDDSEYLGTAARWAARRLLVAPDWLTKVEDLELFRYLTLHQLLQAEDLALVSVWSPTFLAGLLRDLAAWHETLVDDLAVGPVSRRIPGSLAAAARGTAAAPLRPPRLDRLRAALGGPSPDGRHFREIWPNLAVVSCWADGAAAGPFAELRAALPHVAFQPKGLLATEGFTSIPLAGDAGATPAIRSHFFEFAEFGTAATGTRPKLVHELDVGGSYEVLLTTAGGLYRYRTSDRVVVVERRGECPLIRFEGRTDGTSDLVGEKISSAEVEMLLETLWGELGLRPAFALLVPVAGSPPGYRLYLQDPRIAPEALNGPAGRLERYLGANSSYRYAVGLRQLRPAEIALLDPKGPSAWDLYCRGRADHGQRLGDVKPVALDRSTDWEAMFEPWIVARATAADKPA